MRIIFMKVTYLFPIAAFLLAHAVYAGMTCANSNGENFSVWTGTDAITHFQTDIEIDTDSVAGLPQYPQSYTITGIISCQTAAADPFLLDCLPGQNLNSQSLTGDEDHKVYPIGAQVTIQTSYSTTKSLNGQTIETDSQRLIDFVFSFSGPGNSETLSREISIPDVPQGYVSGECSFW
jgi:hypothetical protein